MSVSIVKINKFYYWRQVLLGSFLLVVLVIQGMSNGWSLFKIIIGVVLGAITLIPLSIAVRNRPELIISKSGIWIRARQQQYTWRDVNAMHTVRNFRGDNETNLFVLSFVEWIDFEIDLSQIKQSAAELQVLVTRYSDGSVPYVGHQVLK